MMNTEKIINVINEKCGTAYDAFEPSVIESFIDADVMGVTEEMIINCLANDIMPFKINDEGNNELDIACILDANKNKKSEKKTKKTKKAKSKTDDGNPFGMFEQAVEQIVADKAEDISKDVAEEVLGGFLKEHKKDFEAVANDITWTCEERGGSFKGVAHKEFDNICEIVRQNEWPMLIGPAGTGKSYTAQQVAKRFNLDFYFAGPATQEYKYLGFVDANGIYHETSMFRAITRGGLLFCDEFDQSDGETAKSVLNQISNGFVDFPNGTFEVHPDFRLMAAANTWGTGASLEYVGNQLDASTLDRFMQEWFDYDEHVEASLTGDEQLLEFIRTFRKACNDYGIKCIASYRAIERCDKFKDVLGIAKTLKMALTKNLEADDLNMLVDRFKGHDEWSEGFRELVAAC